MAVAASSPNSWKKHLSSLIFREWIVGERKVGEKQIHSTYLETHVSHRLAQKGTTHESVIGYHASFNYLWNIRIYFISFSSLCNLILCRYYWISKLSVPCCVLRRSLSVCTMLVRECCVYEEIKKYHVSLQAQRALLYIYFSFPSFFIN